MAQSIIRQWDIPYSGTSLRDTRNAIIAEHVFDDKKVWCFYDQVEKKDREFKTYEACMAAWEDVPGFAKSQMAVVPMVDRIRPGFIDNATKYLLKRADDVTITVHPDCVVVGTDLKEGYAPDTEATALYERPSDLGMAMVAALYVSLLLIEKNVHSISFKV